MTSTKLQTIDISQLKIGMYVHGIVKQQTKTKMKSHGKVKNDAVIQNLKEKGVLQLQIDLSKAFDPVTGEDVTSQITAEAESTNINITQVKQSTPKKMTGFNDELHRAAKLHEEGKNLQHSMLTRVAEGLHIDIDVPKEFTESLVESIDRNPNALICLSKIKEKNSYLLEHSLNVAILLANFAKFLGLPTEEAEELCLTGFLHDIGKIKVPDNILNKPGRLTDTEMVVMRHHVIWGVETLRQADMSKRIIRTIAEHHERLDGLGYPKGSQGSKISKFGRMIAIVDSYDAITSDRCYKQGMPSQKALQILLNDSPLQYDRELVQQFVKCIGVYPVGSLVKLTNQQVAMVVSQNEKAPLMPIVKVFYSLRSKMFLSMKDINLSLPDMDIAIEDTILDSDIGINFNRFFEEKIAI